MKMIMQEKGSYVLKYNFTLNIIYIYVLVFTFSLSFLNCYSQAPKWLWALRAKGDNTDAVQDLCTDSQGNSYSLGWFQSQSLMFLTDTLYNPNYASGSTCIFITKHDFSGKHIWTKKFGGTKVDMGIGICQDSIGNLLITGNFSSPSILFGSTLLTNTAMGSSDVFIAKLDTSGNVQWAKKAGGNFTDRSNGISVDKAGNSYISGYFGSTTMSFGTITLTNAGTSQSRDIFIAKYDSSGVLQWATRYGGTADDESRCIGVDAAGNSFISGSFNSTTLSLGSFILTTAGMNDIFIAKFDALGNTLWACNSGGPSNDWGCSISIDAIGNAYITGRFGSPVVTFGNYTLPLSIGNIFIVKFNPYGNVIWAKVTDGYADVTGIKTAAESIYITGGFASIITFGNNILTTPYINYYEGFIAKFDTSGNALWGKSFGGNSSDFGYSIDVDANKSVYMAGSFQSTSITLDDTTFTGDGTSELFIAKLCGLQSSILSITNVSCNGRHDGSAGVSASGGNPPYSFVWNTSPAQTTQDAISLSAGIYNVTISDHDGCIESLSLSIAEPPVLSVNMSADTTICSGSSSSIRNNLTGGTSPYIFKWNPTTGLNDSTVLSPEANPSITTVYSVIVTDAKGCKSTDSILMTVDSCKITNLMIEVCHGQLYYCNGHSYSESGIYWDTLQTVAGYDSIIVSNLTVNQSFSTAISKSICEGQSYFFNGHVYLTQGIYNDTLHSVHSCDSIIIINLTVNPAYKISNSISLCQGESYMINGHNYASTGNYTDTLFTILGCDSLINTNLFIGSVFSINNPVAICEGQNYILNNHTYSIAGIYRDTLQTINLCDSIITTNLTVNSPPDAGIGIVDTVCYFDTQFNLLTSLAGNPDSNGTWHDDDNSGAIANGIFYPSVVNYGLYHFTYLVSGIPPCSDAQSTVSVWVDVCENINEINLSEIKVFPNPTIDKVNIISENTNKTKLFIYNHQGVLVQQIFFSGNLTIDVKKWPVGVYCVKQITEKFIFIKRFVIE